ncbi:cell division protein FtsZ [Fulvivirgaceae bacterium BMA10]|uniref:Cell division protein FtsZ n=1 Tax=Splendidivirga corallicola TaxID=3051826 RepID=A0ABT8KL30_9BACT|nr:cell division protein FtsZ [Fulvivirgaceae bacterium BMA10]
MSDSSYKFEIPKHHKSIIKVIGVGGGGSNAVNHMFSQGIKDVEFIVCNTDAQALNGSGIPNRLQLGVNLTEGLGAGANPEVGAAAAHESKEEIREMLSGDTRMVFITAGMGGGTGTGAAPVIAKVAKELDILTVGIVTAPFVFEGKKKMIQAEKGIEELKQNCDTVLVILNDNLREIYGNLSITQAFSQADNVLLTAAKGIAEIITVPGHVNVDFEDVKTTMKNSGTAIMGSSETEGENRARRAAEEAISSPLLDSKDINGAQKILLSIISGDQAELQMDELTEITSYIQEKAGDEAQVIFGHGVDPELGNGLRVTVIATGFEQDHYNQGNAEVKKVIDLESNKQITMFEDDSVSIESGVDPMINENPRNQERGYSFDVSKEGNEPIVPKDDHGNSVGDEIYFDLEDNYDQNEGGTVRNNPVEGDVKDDLESKRERLQQEGQRRLNELRNSKRPDFSADDYKNWLEVPAYKRRNVTLQNIPHSSDQHISRFNLNDDYYISKNNKFLHDQPD